MPRSTGFALASARKDLVRRLRDPLALLLWLGIPLVVGGTMVLALGGRGGPSPRAKVLVVDQEQDLLTGLLIGALARAGDGGRPLLELEQVALEEGRARMDRGGATALLILPEGFTRALLTESPLELELVVHPEQRILPRLVQEGLGMLSELVFYAHRLLGPELRVLVEEAGLGSSTPEAAIAAFSVQVSRLVERVEPLLFPPVLAIEDAPDPAGAASAPRSLAAMLLPGIVLMALLFAAQGLAEDLWVERRCGTLRRAAASPGRLRPLVAGKLAAAAVLLTAIALAVLALGSPWLEAEPSRLVLAALFLGTASTAFCAGFLLLQAHVRSQRAGAVIGNLLLFPLLMLGGSFFPLELLPEGLAAIGARTPNGWAVVELGRILAGDLGGLAQAFAVPAAAALVLAAWSALRLERGGGSVST